MYNNLSENHQYIQNLIVRMQSKTLENNLELASEMAILFKFSLEFYLDNLMIYRYKYSNLEHTPFEKFSQKIRNIIYKNFIDGLTIKGYISLKFLELMQEEFALTYVIYGPTDYKMSYRDTLLLQLTDLPFRVEINDINSFFTCITSDRYHISLKKHLSIFNEEYNMTYGKNELFKYKDIDKLITYIDVKDNKQVIEYLYAFPLFYNYLKEHSPKTAPQFWVDFFLAYKCLSVAKRHQKTINNIIEKIIDSNFLDNETLFNRLINTKSVAHMSIYFGQKLKSELRKNFDLCLICYANSCAKHRKDVRRMLGPKVTQSPRFKYLFGTK